MFSLRYISAVWKQSGRQYFKYFNIATNYRQCDTTVSDEDKALIKTLY